MQKKEVSKTESLFASGTTGSGQILDHWLVTSWMALASAATFFDVTPAIEIRPLRVMYML